MNSQYEIPLYSRSRIEKAGKVIAHYNEESAEFNEFLPVVDNWRAAHAYPLDTIANILRDVVIDDDSFVVHRLKRLDSIINKLKRNNNTGLYRMQDLGGCRVIVNSLDMVYEYATKIKNSLELNGHEVFREDDYIKSPRVVSGYRSYHIIVKLHCAENSEFDGMFIEIQIRTKLEHVWATTVEMMDVITKDTLKAGTGNSDYMRFFKLCSALFSLTEKTPIVDGVPLKEECIIEEIYTIDKSAQIREKLAAYNSVIESVKDNDNSDQDIGYYLLIVHMLEKQIEIRAFPKRHIDNAMQMYQDMEKEKKNRGIDIVLISTNSINNIREAYPNYFLMTYAFLMHLDHMCSKYPEKPSVPFTTREIGVRVLDRFHVSRVNSSLPEGVKMLNNTVGANKGAFYFIPSCNITLEESYLRFSAPIWNESFMLSSNEESECEIVPHEVIGPAVVVANRGGCFYMNKPRWYFLCDEDAMIIQPNDNTDNDSLLLLLGWMKSNLFAWDLLWNYHVSSITSKECIEEMYMPKLLDSDLKEIVAIVSDIIQKEYAFVDLLNEQTTENEVGRFNNEISTLLLKSECIFDNYYGVSRESKALILQELSIKGYFIYG